MNAKLNIKQLRQKLSKYLKILSQHAAFLAVLIVLFAYIALVWQISNLSTADPSQSEQVETSTKIPKIDQRAINQIQALEQNNTQVHSLFMQARNNPFQE